MSSTHLTDFKSQIVEWKQLERGVTSAVPGAKLCLFCAAASVLQTTTREYLFDKVNEEKINYREDHSPSRFGLANNGVFK